MKPENKNRLATLKAKYLKTKTDLAKATKKAEYSLREEFGPEVRINFAKKNDQTEIQIIC